MTLPTAQSAYAVKMRLERFNSIRPCKECGMHEKYFAGGFTIANIACAECEPKTDVKTSKTNISSHISKHNRQVKKLVRKNWSIPTVCYSNIK